MFDPRDLDERGLLLNILQELQSIRYLLEEQAPANSGPEPKHIPTITPPVIFEKQCCSKCGMPVGGVMGYVCNDLHCPTFLKVTC